MKEAQLSSKKGARGRLFLIHWNEAEAQELAEPLRADGWIVETESEDGARAGHRIKADPPQAVVIYHTRLPSHGRETAHYLKYTRSTRDIPVIFVDGSGEALARTKAKVPRAIYTASARLKQVLSGVARA